MLNDDAETPPPAEIVAVLEIHQRWIESCDSNHIKVIQMANFLNIAKAEQPPNRKEKRDYFLRLSECC